MDLHTEIIIVIKITVAFLAGGFIGFDRERRGSDAGMRTYAAVCLGATLFTSIAEHLADTAAASRIIANIVVGIGFLGAGIIYKDNATNSSVGLTTAATVWCTAAIGVSIGLDLYIIGAVASLALYFLLSLPYQKWYVKWLEKIKNNKQLMK
ncbi:MAG: hypothetical protein C0490_24745 [Marivirga sp.]|nr:hypothetical protein [Marivirga sp.]